MIDIRLPELTGGSEQEQLQQIRSYLYQLAGQLQYALGTVSIQTEKEVQALRAAAAKSTSVTPAATFTSIKSLIIKSAEIVDAWYEQVERRLEGQYVAQSAFGDYAERTEQAIRENSEGITRSFTDVQELQSRVEGIASAVLETQAYIRTGLLYYREDGGPMYGVEIGQQSSAEGVVRFRKFARLTAEKLSFYDSSDVEVAWISDRQLHITEADIRELTAGQASLGGLRIGDYSLSLGTDGHLTLG